MKRRIERSPLPDPVTLRRLVGERASELREGAIVVDADAQGSTGIDMLLVDEQGAPIFVDVVVDAAASIPSRVFDHLGWVEKNKRLFLKAYAKDGVVNAEQPEFIFVAGRFPEGVVRAVRALGDAQVRLVRAEYLIVDGDGELLLEDVTQSIDSRPSATAVPSVGRGRAATIPKLEDGIDSPCVRTLLGLFRSGVDGLDPRIVETGSNGGVTFELEGSPLARVSVSPGSFTVSPGGAGANPIVVSDRISLERALHAVVSQFVREDRSPGPARAEGGVSEAEKAELTGIWGSGIASGEES